MARPCPAKLARSALSIEDAIALAVATLASFVCIQMGWFDRFCMMLRREQQYELDEYVGASFIFLTAAFVMFVRREWQLRARLAASNAREQSARKVARKDHLTGLANRLALMERMEKVRAENVVFLLIDLDGFKTVNDRHGHAAGDEVLKEVSDRLKVIADGVPGSLVARLGGDEFGCLLTDSSGPEERTVRQEITTRLEEPIRLASGTVIVGASIGGAASVNGQFSPDELLHLSDIEMYEEKIRRVTVRRASARQVVSVGPMTDNSFVTAAYRRYRTLEMLREGLLHAFPPSQDASFEDILAKLSAVEETPRCKR